MNDKETVVCYEFFMKDRFTGQTVHHSREFDHEAVLWDEVLRDFLSFLSGIYGYDIHSQVSYPEKNLASIFDDWGDDDWPDEEDSKMSFDFTEEKKVGGTD